MKLTAGRNQRARTWLLCGLLVSACFAAIAWQYDREVQQAQLNQNLLDAISSQRAAEVQSLLRAGADPNTRVLSNTPPPPPWQTLAATLRRLWRHQRPTPRSVYPTALLLAMGAQDVIATPNAQIVQRLLDAGANPNAVGPMFSYGMDSNAPLVWAVQQDQPQIVWLLLNKHADARAQDVAGNPCLSLAVNFDHPNAQAVAALLLAQGVDVNARDFLGETPLITAAGSEVNPALIKLLLDHGADVSARNPDGETALFKFILSNQQVGEPGVPQVTKMLLDAGANVNDKDKFGNSVLQMSVGTKAFPLLLSRGAKIFTPKDPQGAGLLIWACNVFDRGQENYNLVETVLAHRVSINAADTDGTTALLAAADRDVLESNSNVSPQNPDYKGAPVQPKLIGYLLKRGAAVDAKDKQGRTALMVASEASDPQADLVLLAHGANVNARDRYGRTALMWAVAKGNIQTARALLAHGADKAAQDSKGRTALNRARKNRFDANPPFDSPHLGRDFVRLLSK